MRIRLLRGLGVVAIAAATLAPAVSALAADAQTSSPGDAIVLSRQMTGHLNAGGNLAFYKFFYPADGTVATVNLELTPADAFIVQNAGFNIYDPKGDLVTHGGVQLGLSPTILANVIESDMSKKGDYTVQVFNYDPNRSVDFSIWLTGVAQQPATEPAPAPAPAPAAAPAPAPAAAPSPAPSDQVSTNANKGHLEPNGNFAEYTFEYPGDSSVYTVNMHLTPDDPAVLKDAGFEIYAPDGSLQVRGGNQHGMFANVSANVISTMPGRYLVKVFNYHPTAAVDYEVTLVTSPPSTAAA